MMRWPALLNFQEMPAFPPLQPNSCQEIPASAGMTAGGAGMTAGGAGMTTGAVMTARGAGMTASGEAGQSILMRSRDA